jgi:regulatory protein
MENEEKLEQDVFARMARLCSTSEQCSPDLRKKIRDLGCDGQLEERIIARLEKEKFLSDDRFVRAYVREKFRINKWGRIKMEYYLKMKGLSHTMIEAGFTEIDEKQYIKLLLQTMNEKARTIKKTNKYEKMGQIIRFAQGRGFEPELIHRHLNEVSD